MGESRLFHVEDRAGQAVAFLETLLHDDRGSFYALSSASPRGWSESLLSKPVLIGKVSRGLEEGRAWYVSRNGFVSTRRGSSRARQVNAFMFDIDAHGASPRSAAWMLSELDALVAQGLVPEPTMVVSTGRGIHVYYVLESSISVRRADGSENSAMLSWFSDLQDRLAVVFEERFDGDGVDVDSAVYDLARVARVPGTWNPKASCFAELVREGGPFVSLPALSALLPREDPPSRPARGKGRSLSGNAPRAAMHASRARRIERLQASRGGRCEGTRELMCFLYYNACTQAYGPDDAAAMVRAFNARFSAPLPAREVSQVVRSVDSAVLSYGPEKGGRGYYPVSNARIAELLSVTPAENDEIGFVGGPSRAKAEKRAAAKAATAARRAARDAEIALLAAEGSMTRREIASRVGCSLRTVAYVLAAIRGHDGGKASVAGRVQKAAPGIDVVFPRGGGGSFLEDVGGRFASFLPALRGPWAMEKAPAMPGPCGTEAVRLRFIRQNIPTGIRRLAFQASRARSLGAVCGTSSIPGICPTDRSLLRIPRVLWARPSRISARSGIAPRTRDGIAGIGSGSRLRVPVRRSRGRRTPRRTRGR